MKKRWMALALGFLLLVAQLGGAPQECASAPLIASAAQGRDSCIVTMTGDVNLSSSITSGDIIYLVRYVFLIGPMPQPCRGAGDVNRSGQISSADIVFLVGYVFKSGFAPCDICTSEFAQALGCIQ